VIDSTEGRFREKHNDDEIDSTEGRAPFVKTHDDVCVIDSTEGHFREQHDDEL
jgi:hypothetical protein